MIKSQFSKNNSEDCTQDSMKGEGSSEELEAEGWEGATLWAAEGLHSGHGGQRTGSKGHWRWC